MSNHENIVLDFLREHPNSSPLEVAKAMKAADETVEVSRKTGNGVLYRLQKQNKVIKTSNPDGTKPKWSVADAEKKLYTREDFVSESIGLIKDMKSKMPEVLLPEQVSDLLDVVEDLRSALESIEMSSELEPELQSESQNV